MFASLATIVLAASSALALPRAFPRQTSDPCAKFGEAAFGNDGPFTFAAVNRSLDTTEQGVPLVLGPAISTSNDPNLRSLVTFDSYPNDEFSTFDLKSSGLFASRSNGTLVAGSLSVNAGDALNLLIQASPDAIEIYCAFVGTSPAGHNPLFPNLGIESDSDDFSLCKATSAQSGTPLNAVVYKPSSDTGGLYDFDSCYPVDVQLVEAQ